MGKLFHKLKDFSGSAPLFPIPNVVFYPRTFLPLHVFEPRYRAMVEDVEKGGRMICVVLPAQGDPGRPSSKESPGDESNREESSLIHSVGTLAYMDYKSTLGDGTFDILLVGIARAVIREIPTDKPYRMGKLTIQQDISSEKNTRALQKKIYQQFQRLAGDERISILSRYFREGLDFEMAVNFIAAHIPLATEEKQKLLELDDLSLRAKVLLQFMESEFRNAGDGDGFLSPFPGDLRMN